MKKSILIVGVIILAVAGIFLLLNDNSNLVTGNVICEEDSCGLTNYYTLGDVSGHNSLNDCWMIVDGKVYDITEFANSGNHGPAVTMGCGIDATTLYNQREKEDGSKVGSGTPHSDKAKSLLENYYIGDLN